MDVIKGLCCSKCGGYLEKLHTNEELQEMYPVSDNDFSYRNRQHMKLWMELKRLWKCPDCGYIEEISGLSLIWLSIKKKIGWI